MISISFEKFIGEFSKQNPSINEKYFTRDLKNAVKRKTNESKCIVCENPIWAIGSAVCGSDMCFSCITGEADSSKDYEIDTVNF